MISFSQMALAILWFMALWVITQYRTLVQLNELRRRLAEATKEQEKQDAIFENILDNCKSIISRGELK